MEEDIPITERVEPVKPKTPPPPAPEKIEVVEDEKEVAESCHFGKACTIENVTEFLKCRINAFAFD
jgi:hypothetical protein